MFGLPGGAILPVYDPIIDSSIRHILVRHEQGAGHMAEGYAMVTGRPGVAMVTSGPGATNIVTPLSNAYMDSMPLVVVTGQVATAAIGTDAFQECDITGVTMGITKHNWLVKDAARHPPGGGRGLPRGHHRPARPGARSTCPRTSSNATMEWYWPETIDDLDLPGYHPVTEGDPELVAPGGRADPGRRAPGHLRRRRHPEGPGGRGAARAGRAHRHPGRHHADGPGRLPRLPPAVPRACRACTATTRRSPPCSSPTSWSPSAPASTTG